MTKNWTAIQGALSGFSRVKLVGLVQDLYRADPKNHDFPNARFLVSDGGTDLSPYKKRIKAAINPSQWDAPIKYRDARRAISDYNKAIIEQVYRDVQHQVVIIGMRRTGCE